MEGKKEVKEVLLNVADMVGVTLISFPSTIRIENKNSTVTCINILRTSKNTVALIMILFSSASGPKKFLLLSLFGSGLFPFPGW